ncbi:DEAD/DEAH box helicase [Parabacteroides sp. PF5-6]|uniref:DEAD/DEAH box helicase n=1 Tax=Parabacteroides sp. PF5-6 TaxID=1742403 RepID=UPI002404A899|nr:DEAD/DEAH box helicase [Parabacteroides sp. PF5-6]MDF9831186.1 SNF2 family DNA or RNA helicase [Parabacteroides sp. PF5-6]
MQTTKDEIILVLYDHRYLGWKYSVFSAEQTESGSMRILGAPRAEQEEERGNKTEIVRLIKLIGEISDQSLMKLYSKKKSVADFHKEITPELLEKYLRPRIEQINYKITLIARATGIPVFIRTDLSNNTLFVQNRLEVLTTQSACLFNFEKKEGELRYHITMSNRGKEITLLNKRGILLSDKPAVVLIDKEIHCVDKIESKKLTPFFNKNYIIVPAASEQLYIRNFIAKTLLDYEVNITGIPVRQIHPHVQPILTLEEGFNQDFLLLPAFHYNEDRFLPDKKQKKIVKVIESEGLTTIEWYNRNPEQEKQSIELLEQEGLKRQGPNHFTLPDNKEPYGLIEWLSARREALSHHFLLEQNLDITYFVGEIQKESSVEEKIDWFEVKIIVIAGPFRIPFHRFRRHILEGKKEYILPDKRILILPDEWFVQYHDLLRYAKEKGDALQMKKVHAPIVAQALQHEITAGMQERLKEIMQIPVEHPALPTQTRATLRPYQKEGFYWLGHLYRHHFGGCLADDMGLGKTLQTITLLQHIYEYAEHKTATNRDGQYSLFDATRPALPASIVVAPTSLLHNWKNELKRFAPELRVFIYAGANRIRNKSIGQIFDRFEVVITSYGVMRNDIEYIQDYNFQTIILDESQYIKNPSSLSYQSAKRLQSAHRLVLTGTPIENSLEDLWAQFNFINEGLLGSFSSFKKEFIQKIVREKNEEREKALRRMIAPFMLRRTKQEVTPELPPLLQEVVYCDMTEEQQERYQIEKNRVRNTLLEAKENPTPQQKTFIALEGLSRLRQLANHPQMVDPDYSGDSGKFEQILLFFENLKASGHKVLIFSSYVKHLNLIARKFDQQGWKYAMLTGETSRREEEIKRFTDREDVHCFFISLKAGSTGLNLTAADYVFIIDPWWNPAAEMQALSRAHRIGQEKPVIAYRFISTETIEEKILHLQESKSALFETFIESQNPLSKMNWDEIEDLLNP